VRSCSLTGPRRIGLPRLLHSHGAAAGQRGHDEHLGRRSARQRHAGPRAAAAADDRGLQPDGRRHRQHDGEVAALVAHLLAELAAADALT
jgi:hypothetical protein